jgi:hypothetical protein
LGLIRTGRFVLKPERIQRQAELAAMLATVNGNGNGKAKS